jgi:hypothetical protein
MLVEPTTIATIAIIGTCPPSGVGALMACITKPKTTPAISPATTPAATLEPMSTSFVPQDEGRYPEFAAGGEKVTLVR